MKTALKIFLVLTTILSIFNVTPAMAQSGRYTRSARTYVSPQRSATNRSYVKRSQSATAPRGQYQSAESRARQSAQMRTQEMQNARIQEEMARLAAQQSMLNNNYTGTSNSSNSSSTSSKTSAPTSKKRRCADCDGVGRYTCHKFYSDPYNNHAHHNCPQCGKDHDKDYIHSHKCMSCAGQGWK